MPLTTTERTALRGRCHTAYSGHRRISPADEFALLSRWCAEHDIGADVYGEGCLINGFEKKVAALLGKEAAVFMPSGKMAQLIAVKIYAERHRSKHFGMHPTSHLELHEARAYASLLDMHGVLVGGPQAPITAADLAGVTDPLACLLVELPMRECGGILPTWEDIAALSARANEQDIALHMDGARLWECGPYFAPRTYAEVAALFDSVYVSCYKGLNGMNGALLAGDTAFIAAARTWLVRFGGQLPQQTAAVAAVAMRFDAQIAAMPRYVARARSLAQALTGIPGLVLQPRAPQVNMLHLHVACAPDALAEARDALARDAGIWACGAPRPTGAGHGCSVEWYVGDSLLDLADTEVAAVISGLIEAAQQHPL